MNRTPDNEPSQESPPTEPQNERFPVVGIGASAGGIKALQSFFQCMPENSGLAFIVVMHLAPNYESNLAQILQQRTSMPVTQVTESVKVAPNHIYVIPPSKHLTMQDNHIVLVEPQQMTGKRLAVDLLFRTLSVSYGPRAVCIVLSGADSDGAIGVKHVKEQGGMTIAQEPTEAEFDSMPRSVLATGMIDWILPVEDMPARLMEFMRNEQQMHVPPEDVPQSEEETAENGNSGGPLTIRQIPSQTDESALADVLRFLRGQTGHDFAFYKRATILRRVARRLQVNLLEDIPSYLTFLRAHPAETTALLHDLLISVTNFFRDPAAFAALTNYIPQLFADKTAGDQIRVWVAGCATGEEAYSIAIMLSEHASRLESPPTIQVFATDLDDEVIQVARTGLYPTTIEVDVSPDRLRRYFHLDGGRYRINKDIREKVLFSAHNLLKDAPFSRLDLITCRNLLIYLKREAQQAVFDLFHFALHPGGLLFLGSSETAAEGQQLFASLDKTAHIFVSRSVPRASWHITALTLSPSPRSYPTPAPVLPRPNRAAEPALSAPLPNPSLSERRGFSFGDLHLDLLEQFAPPSLVVNSNYDIVHLSKYAGRFLEFTGEPSMNLLRVINPALRIEIRTALFRATRNQVNVSTAPIFVELAGVPRLITLHVRPTLRGDAAEGYLLVLFETTVDPVETEEGVPPPAEPIVLHLDDENQHLKSQLDATVEQYEASLEELKASNEELQSMNEEMRSATEELETSKEELQSINEELTTVNQELKSSLDEFSRVNGDLQNFMTATEIGTIFLDRQLNIKRFTPRVSELFNVIASDIGRPLSDVTHRMNYHHFTQDAEIVLRELSRQEREVSSNGHSYLARILPYRTPDDRIDGVILTFVDITERSQMEAALRASKTKYRVLFDSIDEAFALCQIIVNDEGEAIDYRLLEVNPAFEQMTGIAPAAAEGKTARELMPDLAPQWIAMCSRAALVGEAVRFEARMVTMNRWFDTYATQVGELGEGRFVLVFQDVSERRRAEERRLALERETTLLAERNRMAQELHDTLAQSFTAIKIQMDAAEEELHAAPDELERRLMRVRELAQEGLQEARRSVRALRATALETGGLARAIQHLGEQATTSELMVHIEGAVYSLPALVEDSLYRITQEALTNALRHAKAAHISLTLTYAPDEVRLHVADDGQGFAVNGSATGFGLTGIRERVERIGGALTIRSAPGQGAYIEVVLPTTDLSQNANPV